MSTYYIMSSLTLPPCFFTYSLQVFTSSDHPYICLYSTSLVYISEAELGFIYTMWQRGHWPGRNICWHTKIFVYLSDENLGLFTPRDREFIEKTTIFVYIIHPLFIYRSIMSSIFTICGHPRKSSSAIFVYIICHLLTYQSVTLGLFTPRDLLEPGYPPYLFKQNVIYLHIRG